MALIQLSRMLGGIFREPIWGLVSHPVCQPRCFSAPSMWQQAGRRVGQRQRPVTASAAVGQRPGRVNLETVAPSIMTRKQLDKKKNLRMFTRE